MAETDAHSLERSRAAREAPPRQRRMVGAGASRRTRAVRLGRCVRWSARGVANWPVMSSRRLGLTSVTPGLVVATCEAAGLASVDSCAFGKDRLDARIRQFRLARQRLRFARTWAARRRWPSMSLRTAASLFQYRGSWQFRQRRGGALMAPKASVRSTLRRL